jgi:hypothetical protein
MKVYVLVTGVHELAEVDGVYSTPEAAFAAWPYGEWRPDGPGHWTNWTEGLNYASTASVDEFDVQ